MLKLKDIGKTYRTSKGVKTEALKNINLEFPDKGMVFILGKSGSGKSTLLNIIGGLDSADHGEIIMLGKSSNDFSQSDYDAYRNTYIGFIFQDFQLIETYTIQKNIALALQLQQHVDTQEVIDDILSKVGLEGYGNRYPNELSGGQKQRVAIARALVKHPQILMADEPTGALDSDTGKDIFKLLKKLSEEQLVIVISHDRESASLYADRIIELKDGEVISDSQPQHSDTIHETFQPIASHLPFKASFQLGISCLTHKKLRMVFTILLTSFALMTFGISDALGDFKDTNAHKKAMSEQEETFIGIQHQLFTEDMKLSSVYLPITPEKKTEVSDLINIKFVEEYDYFNHTLLTATMQVNIDASPALYEQAVSQFYPVEMSDFKDLNITETIGSYPKDDHEIAISSYLADLIIKFGVTDEQGELVYAKDYQDIIDKKITLNIYGRYATITGVANYDMSEYNEIKEISNGVLTDELSQTYRKLVSMAELKYNKIYVCEGFMKTLDVKENTALGNRMDEIRLTSDDNEYYIDGIAYGNEPVTYFDGTQTITKDIVENNEIVLSAAAIMNFGYGERYQQQKQNGKSYEDLRKDYMQYATRYIGKHVTFRYASVFGAKSPDIVQDMKVIGVVLPSIEEFTSDTLYEDKSIVSKDVIKDYVLPSVFVRQLLCDVENQDQVSTLIDHYNTHTEYTTNTFITNDINNIQGIAEVISKVFFYVSIAFFVFAAVLMMNFIIISISYRKKDIGILRAIGARSKDVLKIFIWEGASLACISYLLASISMYVLSYVVNIFAMEKIGILLSPIIITLRQPIVLLIMVALICLIACFFPVMKISRQKPIDAIKK